MGTADKEVAGAERTDDLRRARDQRHHAFGLSIGHLAPCYRPATTETRNPTADGVGERVDISPMTLAQTGVVAPNKAGTPASVKRLSDDPKFERSKSKVGSPRA